MNQRSSTPATRFEPLAEPIAFEPIRPEAIEVDEGVPEQKVPEFSRLQVASLITAYLLVFVGNGEITIPLLLVIPLILVNIVQSSFDIILPSLLGAAGLLMAASRLFREPTSRKHRINVNLGLLMMVLSLFFYWTVSEAVIATFFSSLVPAGLYLYWNSTAPKA